MEENPRLKAVLNMVVNSSVLMMTAMTTGMTSAMGEVAAVMDEAISGAFGAEAGKKSGDELRSEIKNNATAREIEELKKSLADMTAQITRKIVAFTEEDRAEFLEDINHESYDKAFDAINKADFGLPKITESLDEVALSKYLKIHDPRFDEIMQLVFSAQPPRVFMRGASADSILEEDAPKIPPASIAPSIIRELPVRYEFPPHFKSTITFPCKEEIMLNWSSTYDGDIEGYGICVESGGSKTSTPNGGTNFYPKDGHINITVTNIEALPITVEISMEVRPQSEV